MHLVGFGIEIMYEYNVQSITQQFILYTIKIVYCQGDMFRPLLGHIQVLWENRSKSYLYFNGIPNAYRLPGPLGKQIQELSIFQCIVGSQMLTNCQALWENRSKSYLYFNGIPNAYRFPGPLGKQIQELSIFRWDPKCLQIVLYSLLAIEKR